MAVKPKTGLLKRVNLMFYKINFMKILHRELQINDKQ